MAARFISTLTPNQIHKPRRLACKECRDRKIKCNAPPDGSGPCSRCRHLGKECRIDTKFKRVNRRQKVEELEEQLKRLRSVVENNGLGQSSHSPDRAVQNGSSLPQSQTVLQQCSYNMEIGQQPPELNVNFTATGPWTTVRQEVSNIRDIRPSGTTPRSIGGIFLDSNQIDRLFDRFFQHFSPFLHIFDQRIPPDEIYDLSQLLFWTIIITASRYYEDDAGLLTALSPSLSNLLWKTASTLPHTKWTLIAMLLICTWPLPTSTMWQDPSFMLISMTRSAAMQLGLHRPELVQDFSRTRKKVTKEDVRDAAKIWSTCYMIAGGLTSTIGFEPLFTDDRLINRATDIENPYNISPELWRDLIIHKFCNQIECVFADRENMQNTREPSERGEHFGILKLLEHDLLDLERTVGKDASELNHITLSRARVQLRIFYFFDHLPPNFRKHGLLKAFHSASDLIVRVSHADISSGFIQHCPAYLLIIVAMAGMILLKILNSSYARYVDVETGRGDINTAISLLRRGSIEDNDACGRCSKILAQLWSAARCEIAASAGSAESDTGDSNRDYETGEAGTQEPALKLQTRLGASILHDTLWKWRRDFGGQGEPGSRTPSDTLPLEPRVTQKGPANVGPVANPGTEPAPELRQDHLMDTESLMDFGFSSLLPVDMESYFSDLP